MNERQEKNDCLDDGCIYTARMVVVRVGFDVSADVGYLVATGEVMNFGRNGEGMVYRWEVRKAKTKADVAKCRRPALRMQCSTRE